MKALKVIGWTLFGILCFCGVVTLLTLNVSRESSWVVRIDNAQEFQEILQGNPDKAIWFVGLKRSPYAYAANIYELTVESHPQWDTFNTAPIDRIPPWLNTIGVEWIDDYIFEDEYWQGEWEGIVAPIEEVDITPCQEEEYDLGEATIALDDYIVTTTALTAPNRVIKIECPICGDREWLTIPRKQTTGILVCDDCGAQLLWELKEIDEPD